MTNTEMTRIYDRYSGAVYRTAFTMCKNTADAEDITQETFIQRFRTDISFEDGVGYTLRLPQGAVCALRRPDITNNEEEVSFVGSSKGAVKTLDYVWCSLYDHHPTDVIDSVLFYYDQPVILSGNPAIQLIMDDSVVVKEVVPILKLLRGHSGRYDCHTRW